MPSKSTTLGQALKNRMSAIVLVFVNEVRFSRMSHLSSNLVDEFVKTLGFSDTKILYFSSGLRQGRKVHQWAIVAKRA